MTNKLSRRDILYAGAVGILAAGITPGLRAAGRSRPNILWLVSEDNGPLIGAYGDRLARTPVLDGLARRGLLYRHAYANAPVCAVSRFGILTGVYPQSCGPAHHMRARAKLAGIFKGYPEYLRESGYYCTNNEKTDYNCDIEPQKIWDESSPQAHWRNRPTGVPFMAVFNYRATHESSTFKPAEGGQGRVRPGNVRVPGYLPDTLAIRQQIASYYGRIEIMDGQLGARLAELEADGLVEETIVFYYSDHGGVFPRSKRFCYEEGLHTCLIIAIPSQYAHLAPAPMGSVIERPVSFIDLVPTLLGLAGIPKPRHMAGNALLDRKVGAPQPYVFGMRDRMDERYDMVRTVTDGRYRYIRNYTPHRPWGQHYDYAWQNRSYQEWERLCRAGKLDATRARFFGPKPHEELYDLQTDPDELTSLVDRPEEQARLEALRSALDEQLLSMNDNGFIPEGSPLEGYVNSRVPGAYPLKRIMAIAAAAASRVIGELRAFETGLMDPNEVIRYWSAQGLLMLSLQSKSAHATLQRTAHKDLSPHVRIVAAEALAALGESAAGVEILTDMLKHPLWPVRLQAINALTFIGPSAKAALESIERARREDASDYVKSAARYLSAVLQGHYDPDPAQWNF